jgi:hypothetical protein
VIPLLTSRPALLLAALALLWPSNETRAFFLAACIAFATYFPARRAEAFSVLAVGCFVAETLPQAALAGLGLRPFVFVAGWVAIIIAWGQRGWAGGGLLRRRPLLVLHGAVVAALTAFAVLNVTGWRLVASAFSLQKLSMELLWRSSYWLKWQQRTNKDGVASGRELLRHLYSLVPFVTTGGVPLGKQPEYMAKHEARDGEALRASQLSGLRLLALAGLWRLLLAGIPLATERWPHLFIPFPDLFLDPYRFTWAQRWGALYLELFRAILELGLYWHTMVAICHLLGFRIPRNTRSPLLASTILEFWNRYFVYFKELLVDFFFFPAYLRLKGWSPPARSALATFAAAFAGNLYYHALLFSSMLMEGHLDHFVAMLQARVVYCLLLASALAVSMLRWMRWPVIEPKPLWRRVAGAGVAATFYALIHIWNAGDGTVSWQARADVVRALFGLGS